MKRVAALLALIGLALGFGGGYLVRGHVHRGSAITTASTQQYASIIARNTVDPSNSLTGLSSQCVLSKPGALCGLETLNAGAEARNLASSLKSAPKSVGIPPSSIAGLVMTTTRDATNLETAASRYSAAPSEQTLEAASQQAYRLTKDLAAWGPYGS